MTRSAVIEVPTEIVVWNPPKKKYTTTTVPTEKVATVIRDAANFLETHKWNRGEWLNEKNGSVCAMGAVDSVLANLYGYKYAGEGTQVPSLEAKGLSKAVETALDLQVQADGYRFESTGGEIVSVIDFNDVQKDKRKVIRLFRRAANNVEATAAAAAEAAKNAEALKVLEGARKVLQETQWKCGPGRFNSVTHKPESSCLMQAVAIAARGPEDLTWIDQYSDVQVMGPAETLAATTMGEVVRKRKGLDAAVYNTPASLAWLPVNYNDEECYTRDDAIEIIDGAIAVLS